MTAAREGRTADIDAIDAIDAIRSGPALVADSSPRRCACTPRRRPCRLYAHALARQPDGRIPTCVLIHPGSSAAPRGCVAVRR
ncbi:hypothetical protein GPA10_35300 [Streptomyces sp. p1417]|uniref:Uncharacterized protein n=1 Tax=Streptomyces typhae TaxID=2681492 RepID=A0A6L6X7J6_9ACTN|nr:hypothetical protein [Streptomyces typhae]MVO89883.1 hypothetical protein [Streptomyces typhae]